MHPDRAIFKFSANDQDFYADPLVVQRRLSVATGGRLGKLLETARGEGPEDAPGDGPEVLAEKEGLRAAANVRALPACDALLQAAYAAFELPPLDRATGKGVTASEVERILFEWFDWLSKKNASPASPPTSPLPTGPACSTSPSASSSDCG